LPLAKVLALRAPSFRIQPFESPRIFINNRLDHGVFDRIDRNRPRTARWGSKNGISFFVICNATFARGQNLSNAQSAPKRDYLTPELRQFFSKRGADIERERIFFTNGVHKQLARSTSGDA